MRSTISPPEVSTSLSMGLGGLRARGETRVLIQPDFSAWQLTLRAQVYYSTTTSTGLHPDHSPKGVGEREQ